MPHCTFPIYIYSQVYHLTSLLKCIMCMAFALLSHASFKFSSLHLYSQVYHMHGFHFAQPCLIASSQFTSIWTVIMCMAFALLSHASFHLPHLYLFPSVSLAWLSLRLAMPHCIFQAYHLHGFRFAQPCLISPSQFTSIPKFITYHLHGFRVAQPCLIAPSQFTSLLKCITCMAFALLSHAILHLPNLPLFPNLSYAWLLLCSAMPHFTFPVYIYV
jgi:hypothetical protein